MRKAIYLIFFFIVPVSILAQSAKNAEQHRKDSLFSNIQRLQKMIAADTVINMVPFRYSFIANNYIALGDTVSAIHFYEKAITTGEFDYRMAKRNLLRQFAPILFERGQYDSLLYYYSQVEKMQLRDMRCGNFLRNFMPDFKYWQMIALDAKGLVDSAIITWLPYAFETWTNPDGMEISTDHYFANDYHCMMIAFIVILEKKYCAEDIYRDVRAFTNQSNFRIDSTSEQQTELKYIVQIGEFTYTIADWDYSGDFDKVAFYETLTTGIKNSLIYRFITGPKNKPASPNQFVYSPNRSF